MLERSEVSTTEESHPPASAGSLLPPTSPENADVHASSDEYAARFGGATGEWMLDRQKSIVLSMLDENTLTVLDVGGGHGQIALPLMDAHRSVTVLGSSAVCSRRIDDFIAKGMISFKVGNLIEIPFPDRSFDMVVCFRLLSHCTQWRKLIEELCRVAKHSVVLDYPVWTSMNFLSPLLFKLKKRVEGNTRAFELFTNAQVEREFAHHGFDLEARKPQFFWPMAVHRLLRRPNASKTLETGAKGLGLTWLLGSPVIAKLSRRETSKR